MNIIDQIEKEQLRNDITPFNIGDTVKVSVKVKEGDKERIQAYEGVVIAKKVQAFVKLSQFVVYHLVSALKELSLCTAQELKKWL